MEVHLMEHGETVLRARSLRRDPAGRVAETPGEQFRRVAHAIARAEEPFGGRVTAGRREEAFLEALAALAFLPNSPTPMNAGTPLGQFGACFVLPVEDSREGICDVLKLMALVQQSGGGTGFSCSRLRPGLVFMRIFDCATEDIRLGSRRRGADRGVLRVDHLDIVAFVEAKRDGRSFALEIPAEGHLDIQAAFQRPVDNAVSQTINLPHAAQPRVA